MQRKSVPSPVRSSGGNTVKRVAPDVPNEARCTPTLLTSRHCGTQNSAAREYVQM